ncbi:hypothetical protein [Dactylosporangium sp. NPDC051484]|uniref:hypothetical protein n=1 Tax=Dactylosporangium sp. NPDC051484 TaxID=3154942 RepID=UPI00344FAE7A
MRRTAERTLRRYAREHLDTDPDEHDEHDEHGDRGHPAEPPALLGSGGERVDPAALLDRRGERLWLLTAPGAGGPRPLRWLLRAAWARAAADPAVAQRPVLVDLASLAADGPVTAGAVLRAVTGTATEHGYLVLLAGLDDAGGTVRAAVAGLPAALARTAPASTIVTLSHAEPVPGFHIPAVVLPDAPPRRDAPVDDGIWEGLAGRLRDDQPWPAGLVADAVAACAAATRPLRRRIIDDLTALADRRLLFRAAVAAGVCDDDGVRRAARTEIESLAGGAPAARDARWLSRLLALLPVLDANGPAPADDAAHGGDGAPGAPSASRCVHFSHTVCDVIPPLPCDSDPMGGEFAPGHGQDGTPGAHGRDGTPGTVSADERPAAHGGIGSPAAHGWDGKRGWDGASSAHELPAARSVLLRMAAAGRPGSTPLTLLARRDPAAAIAAAEESGDPLALDAVASAADEPAVARAVLGRCAEVPGWEPALVYRAQLDRAVATTLLAERDRDAGPIAAGRWRRFAMTRGTAYGRLLDDVLARPWGWPPHAAPLLLSLAQVRPPASAAPIAVAALPRAATGAVATTLAVLACARLAGGHIGPPAAALAILAGLAVAGVLLVRRLRQWQAAVAAVTAMSTGAAASTGATASAGTTVSVGTDVSTTAVSVGARVSASGGDGGGVPVPLRRESVLAAVLGVGPAVMGVVPGPGALDKPLRRACIRAGVPEAEITHLLGALAARRTRLGRAVDPALPKQASRRNQRQA